MKSLTLDAALCTATLNESIPIPVPGPHELLVRVHAVALNPVDALYTAHPLGATGRVIGSDFAGIVASRGAAALPSSPQIGDRVAGFVQGACSVNDRPGAFAEFVVIPADLVWRVPDMLELHRAAAVSLCALTAAQALFLRLGVPAPFEWSDGPKSPRAVSSKEGTDAVFVYGASTSVGLYAAQLVRCAAEATGRPIRLIGASSAKNHQFLLALPYGYDHLVDYRDRDWPEQVRARCAESGVTYAFDCISEGQSVKQVASTLGPGGALAVVRSREGQAWEQDGINVDASYGAVWEGLGVEVEYQGFTVKASREARNFTVAFYDYLSQTNINGVGHVEPNPTRLMPGSLERIVPDGFVLLGAGSMGDRNRTRTETWMAPISAEKVVYRIDS